MQSTASDEFVLTGPVELKLGDKVHVTRSGTRVEVGTVVKSEGSGALVKPGNWSVPRPPRPPRMVAHSQMGHSFWPRRNRSPHYYECCRCSMTKPPGAKPEMDCQNYLKFKVVQEVHDR